MPDVRPSANFSAVAHRYDETRDLPTHVLTDAYRRVGDLGLLAPETRILDVGCGTGQVSLPLIRQGYRVTGVDISPAMIEIARAKSQAFPGATFLVADAQALPFADGAFDLTTVSKLFMHVGNWQGAIDEILRVTRDGGAVVHVAERGAFKYTLRQRLNELADAAGYHDRFMGAQTSDEVRAYFRANGCAVHHLEFQELCWEKRITYAQQLADLNARLFAEYWSIPDTAHQEMMARVEQWARAEPEGLDIVETMYPYLTADVYVVPHQ